MDGCPDGGAVAAAGMRERGNMEKKIADGMIEYIAALAKLELTGEERERIRTDMEKMLSYIDMLGELDTEGEEPAVHIFPVENVFREDVVTNGDGSGETLRNAPEEESRMFVVPRTVEL